MKKLKIFPKTFLYSLAIMLLIVGVAHLILYLLLPQMVIDFVPSETTGNVSLTIAGSYEPAGLMKSAMLRALPLSVICCVFLSVLCAYFFSKGTTSSIRQLSKAVKKMSELDKSAQCRISSQDELGELANDVNQLYHRLLCMIENLELEKEKTSENERAKIDFLRSASHELKTPVTALNAMLENMILGVGRYQDYDACLPECKAITERLSEMIHEILETSKLSVSTKNAALTEINVSELLVSLCEPYQLIAATHGVQFRLKIDDAVSVELPIHEFSKALSNILGNAVGYTPNGKCVSVYLRDHMIVVENECTPISKEELPHLFEPFYRPDFSRSRETGGNGLGLYIVATIFRALNVPYSFTPMEQPQGMRFTIQLMVALPVKIRGRIQEIIPAALFMTTKSRTM